MDHENDAINIDGGTESRGCRDRPLVVGVGASAGGLEALTTLLSHMPPHLGVCFVVVQHLSPTYRSMLVQLLGRETNMVVREISDRLLIEADTVNIAPASHNVVIEDKCFRLTPMSSGTMPRPSVNLFFTSLAEQCGEAAMGIILSGTGSDGAAGIRAIKAAGGYTFAQEPHSAKYSGMPQSAIDTDCVDWILGTENIAKEIEAIVRHQGPFELKPTPPSNDSLLKKLLARVRQKTKIDFSGYKESTLWRRIERRMAANHVVTLEDYLQLTEQNGEELERLSKDILISVTAFFRDRIAFTELEHLINHILSRKQSGDEVRIWVPGCATGEEAYSIAILLAERIAGKQQHFRVQIFATDIDLSAMTAARRGVYALAALGDMDKTLIKKYFIQHGDRYEIIKILREMVVFARQDLVQDPPFLRLDLISCRNLLIYFQTDLQAKILATFHYALNPTGYLFLGRSETTAQQDNLFDTTNKDAHIFAPRDVSRRPPLLRSSNLGHYTLSETVIKTDPATNESNEAVYKESALRHYLPAGVLVDANFAILHIQGDVGNFLAVSAGKPNFDLLNLIRREFRADAQTLINQAQKKGVSVFGRPKQLKLSTGKARYRLAVHPSFSPQTNVKFLVCFETYQSPDNGNAAEASAGDDNLVAIKALEDELITTREHLQSVIEELETSNEEMQALNEEVQAANEELQSSNEELESANEELQSTNQELITINEELQIKTNELAMMNNDIESIINNLGFPLLVVNDDLLILRINRQAAHTFNLGSLTPELLRLNHIKLPIGIEDLPSRVLDVIKTGQVTEFQSRYGNDIFTIVMSPYEYRPPRIGGVVISLIDATELLAAQEQLKENQAKLLDIMNHSTSIIALKDLAGRYLFVNQRFEEFFQIQAANILGRTDAGVFDARLAGDMRDKELETIRLQRPIECDERLDINQNSHWLNVIRFPLRQSDGTFYAVCTQAIDISQRKQAEEQLQLAARVFDRSGEGIMVTDADGRILTVNHAFTHITGYSLEEAVGQNPSLLSSGKHDRAFFNDMWRTIEHHDGWQGEIWNRRKNGEIFLEWLTITAIKLQSGEISNYVGIFSDISSIKESQRRIEFLATHDPLTQLPNRNLFNDRAGQALINARRHRLSLAIMFVDLDNFKLINDTLGHDIGDQVVIGVGDRLRECVRASDTVARFGGDEFAILLDDIDSDEINITARRVVNCLIDPIRIESREVFVSGSIGIRVFPNDGDDIATLIKHADVAMYQAKDKGKNNYQFFCDDMRQQVNERLQYETCLRQAIDSQIFQLVYQPQIDIESGQLAGMEALIRWHHPDLGPIGPDKFIPIAEQAGLIDRIGEWVLKSVINQIFNWRKQGLEPPRVSINLSPRHFRKTHVPSLIKRYLATCEIEPHSLGIEFTETALLDNAEYTIAMLWELKKMGIHLSLDDFGTGYSSLVYLKRYPIDEIKIDRSFTQDVVHDLEDRAIVLAILAMSRALGIQTVAEGVENIEQLELLKSHRCNLVQGYLYSAPLPPDAMAQLMVEGHVFSVRT